MPKQQQVLGFLRAAEGAVLSYYWSKAVLGVSVRLDAKANGHTEPMLWATEYSTIFEEHRVAIANYKAYAK